MRCEAGGRMTLKWGRIRSRFKNTNAFQYHGQLDWSIDLIFLNNTQIWLLSFRKRSAVGLSFPYSCHPYIHPNSCSFCIFISSGSGHILNWRSSSSKLNPDSCLNMIEAGSPGFWLLIFQVLDTLSRPLAGVSHSFLDIQKKTFYLFLQSSRDTNWEDSSFVEKLQSLVPGGYLQLDWNWNHVATQFIKPLYRTIPRPELHSDFWNTMTSNRIDC